MDIKITLAGGNLSATGLDATATSCKLSDGRCLHIFGEIFYHLNGDRVRRLNASDTTYLRKLFSSGKIEDIIPSLEGQYLGIITNNHAGTLTLFCDRYARQDYFYAQGQNSLYLSDSLDFIFKHIEPRYDQRMLAHLFSVYGWYTPKGTTIYSNIRRLKVGEVLTISAHGTSSKLLPLKPLRIQEGGQDALDAYYRSFRDSVSCRAAQKGINWVSSSSGWDSSLVLGMLVDLFGAKNVGMVTGSMKYSAKTAVINKFEIDKIKKIGSFYGLKPHIVDFDLKNKRAPAYWRDVLPYYKAKHNYSYVTFNFARLSDKLTSVAGRGQTIFNGETSDSFHNFGFSQFATFFHTQKPFTEYADKMNCYLYGPSFFKKVLDGSYQKDRVYKIFRAMNPRVPFADSFSSRAEKINSYLLPLFYGSPRIPFARVCANPALTSRGQKAIAAYPFQEYCPGAMGVTPETLYSWIIHLYHSFHSQGATVNVQKYAMESNGHHWRSPFNDYRVIETLSQAPESWGRGLDFNHTKHPLKWVARNKIKFPYELLQEGPHSYLYDVIEGFSLFAEITYRSGVTPFFKEVLADKPYRRLLTDEYIDLRYVDRLADGFMADKEVRGQDFNNLVSLLTLCATGWY